MKEGPASDEAAARDTDQDEYSPPRADMADAVGWFVLGVAVLVGSIAMDRLEQQHINPYTVPGLLPGLLGIAMILLAAVLAERSWERGAFTQPRLPMTADKREELRRVWVVAQVGAVQVCQASGCHSQAQPLRRVENQVDHRHGALQSRFRPTMVASVSKWRFETQRCHIVRTT